VYIPLKGSKIKRGAGGRRERGPKDSISAASIFFVGLPLALLTPGVVPVKLGLENFEVPP